MPFVTTQPEALAAAAGSLQNRLRIERPECGCGDSHDGGGPGGRR